MDPILEAKSLGKVFPRSGGQVEVLRDCHFSLSQGESVAITGPSGSGKSTLLNILGGLDEPTAGQVLLKGTPLDFGDHAALTRWRSRGVGFIFQFHFLLPDFTALENLLMPVRGHRRISDQDKQRAMEFLEITGLADRADHLPGELSGGEQQRVAVARAFMNRPGIVLADEPFGNLDREIGARLGDMLFGMGRQERTSLVIVTHDPELAARTDRHLQLTNMALATAEGIGKGAS
ncbi:MAG: ABC transporter ATP-binding protein [Gemmatimonadales bacterium]|nr:ABC transporter ATP-binding protein [Gemmatimonadales bacterium]